MIFADLHIHSRFSRATSKNLNLENMEKWAKIKGLNLLGTGDFTHPKWISELKSNLEENDGILKTKTGFSFILQTEVSLIYSQDGKGRRVHLLILAPDFSVAEQINDYLSKKGRLDYDGRPVFNIPCYELVENLISISKDIEIIPAHAWTPWFGIFGSVTGFDSIEEAFKDKAKYIHAFETGMSSDPEMNWRLSSLDKYSIVSFSDSHSFWPWRLGREATIFDFDINNLKYKDIITSIRNNKIKATIETFPSYGKYHFDGHRNCNFSCSPEETKKLNGICPLCKKSLIIGVMNRVERLADRPKNFKPKNAKPFYSLLPLSELISVVRKIPLGSKKIMDEYTKMVEKNSEFDILLNLQNEQLMKISDEKLIKLIMLNRNGKIKIKPGYDGVYGTLIIEEQAKLF
ncbi:MAG: endonuclease Q family protein [Candidatus Pacearchaeota archaeon]